MKSTVCALICAASFTACATAPPPSADAAKYGPRPSANQAKAAAVAYAQARFKDPKLRNIVVTMPNQTFCAFAPGFVGYSWSVVFEVNGKNSSGVYTGYVYRRVLLRQDGRRGACPPYDPLSEHARVNSSSTAGTSPPALPSAP